MEKDGPMEGGISQERTTNAKRRNTANGQWATDEATGEKGYIDDERSCFWTWTTTSMLGSPVSSKVAKLKRRKGKGEGKGKGGFKGTGKTHFGEEQAQDPEWWSEEDGVQEKLFEKHEWWSQEDSVWCRKAPRILLSA